MEVDAYGIGLKEVYDTFEKLFRKYDRLTIDLFLASVVTNKLDGKPFWVAIVAPSSYGKTTLTFSVDGIDSVKILNEFTHASIYPAQKGYPSIAEKLDGKIAIITDSAQLFTAHPDLKKRTWGALRSLYDGVISRATQFGEINIRLIKPPTLIMCATPIIDQQITFFNELGTREFLWRMAKPELKDIKEIENLDRIQEELKKNIQEVTKKFLKGVDAKIVMGSTVEIADEEYHKIDELGDFLANMRASGLVDAYSGELASPVSVEAPVRCEQGLCKLLRALKLIGSEHSMEIIEKLVKDTVDQNRIRVLNALTDEEKTIAQISNELNLARKTVKGELMILKGLKLAENEMEEFTNSYGGEYTKTSWSKPKKDATKIV